MAATSENERSPLLPGVPTLREAEYKLVAARWYRMFAPTKTPSDVIEWLNKAIVDAAQSSDVKERPPALRSQRTGTSPPNSAE